jgi:FkbM family methyltransferase
MADAWRLENVGDWTSTPGCRESYAHVSQELYSRQIVAAVRAHRPADMVAEFQLKPVARVSTNVGELFIAADDAIILPHLRAHGCWEPVEGAVVERYLTEGATAVVIGAHIGYHVLRMSRVIGPAGRVLAVEPEPQNFAMLCANLAAAGVGNVLPIEAVAAERAGVAELSVPTNRNSGDYRAFASPDRSCVSVAALALDDILLPGPRVECVLSDAQGTDHHALRGMRATVSRDRPTILVEFWPAGIDQVGDDPRAVLAEYVSWGYDIRLATDTDGRLWQDHTETVRTVRRGIHDHATLLLRPR